MASESSAVIQFIADNQRRPVDRGLFSSRKIATPAIPVLMPIVASPWKARLTFAGALLLVGAAGGLYAGQTAPGRALVASITSPHAELAPSQPTPPAAPPATAAAAMPCATPAAIAAAPIPATPAPPPAPVPAPAVVPAIAAATPAPAAPEPAAAIPRPRPRREGTLRLRSTPTCDILVDGHKTGYRTPHSLKLKPGKHTVTLVNKKARVTSKFSVRIDEGKTTRVTKKLQRKKH